MGRPKVPYRFGVLVPTYPATVNNYAWEGLPTANQPVLDYILPESPIAADEMTWVLKSTSQSVYDQDKYLGRLPAHTWMGATLPAGSITSNSDNHHGVMLAPVFDPANARWWATVYTTFTSSSSQTYVIAESPDGGRTWFTSRTFTLSSTGSFPTAMCVRPTDGAVVVVSYDGSGAGVGPSQTFDPSSSTWTSHTTAPNDAIAGKIVWFNSKFVYVGAGGKVYTSTDGGATWTAGTTLTLGFSGLQALVTDGTTLIVLGSTTGSTGAYYTTTDGSTWTSHSLALNSGENVVGAAYSSSGFFYATTYDGTNSRVLTAASASPTTWTVANGTSFLSVQVSDIAAIGALLVLMVPTTNGGSPKFHKFYCSDDAGATWSLCRGAAIPSPVKTSLPAGGVVSTGDQFMSWTPDAVNGSFITGI